MVAPRSPSPDNDVFAFDTAFVPERINKTAGITSISFDGVLRTPLRLYEDLKEGCGGQLWPAGMVLSRYILKAHRDLKGKNVVEIGAGGGLVGLAVALGCELDVPLLITDQKAMSDLMQKNITLNGLQETVTAEVYDWGTSSPVLDKAHPDIVLAADCVYFEPAFPLLLQALQELVGPESVCYFCFKKRRKADMRFIRDMMKKFDVEQIDYEGREQDQRESIWLYALREKKKTSTRI